MTDFLQRISQAALGLTPAIQPLVVSRYAPRTRLSGHEMPTSNINLIPGSPAPPVAPAEVAHTFEATTLQDSGTPNLETDRRPGKHGVIAPIESPGRPATLSGEDAETSSSLANPQDGGGRISEGPTKNVSAAKVIDVQGVAPHRRGSASSATSESTEDVLALDLALDEASLATNRQPGSPTSDLIATGFPRGSKTENKGAADHRSAVGDTASRRSGDEELLELDGNKIQVHKTVPNTQPVPIFDRGRLDGEIEPEGQGHFGQHVTPLRSGPGLLDQARSRREEPRSPESPEDRSKTSSENVIRVTIGRIDVRAVTPPLPPIETPARHAPKLSLDEFLRQHNGRSR